MKRIAVGMLLFVAISNIYGAPPQERQQRQLRPNAAQRRSLVEDAVLGFYVKQFQQFAEVTPEVFARILPFLEQFVQDRFEISQRRTRALNQLRQALNRSGSEDELKRLVRELDSADGEFQMNQQKFFSNVEPPMNIPQPAQIPNLQKLAHYPIRQKPNALQNPARQRQPPAPATGPN